GLSLLTNQILTNQKGKYQYIDYVKKRNLALYLWGDTLNSTERVKDIESHKVDMLIFDRSVQSRFSVITSFLLTESIRCYTNIRNRANCRVEYNKTHICVLFGIR